MLTAVAGIVWLALARPLKKKPASEGNRPG
jgi:hypothetical protein